VLTRELLYNAVTRARRRLHVIGDMAVWCSGVSRSIERHSGLSERLLAL
jgi:ATP-dependent exoDNAse (exonuclease V) alpha subunit